MTSIFTIIGALAVIYLSSYGYSLLRNFFHARKSGLPYIFVPWDQNSFFWMVACVPLQPLLQKYLPTKIYDRLSLTIYGHEFRELSRPFDEYAAPQGNSQTYVLLTTGRYEVSTRDPEIATEILKRPRDFVVHELTSLFMNRFGHNVLTSNGDSWSRQRKIVASTINEKISKVVFEESLKQTEGLIDEVVGTKCQGETNGLFDMMKKIAINVLSGASMGASVEWTSTANGVAKPGYKLTYIEAVKVVIDAVAGPIILPQWFLSNYPSFLPGHQFLHDLSHAVTEFPIHTKELLDQERQHSESPQSSIMSQLLAASDAAGEGHKTQSLSEEEQIGNLFIFTAAGFDTTANTLAFALVLLARYPQWQDWLYSEILEILPSSTDTTTTTASSIVVEEWNYTHHFPRATRILAVMLETLRLYPPLTHISRQTTSEQRIKTSNGETYFFPAKSTVYINIPALHLAPSVWRNLNLHEDEEEEEEERDEERFRPTRWLTPTSTSQNDNASGSTNIFQPPKGTYMPWSGGPRICPGQKMAQVEFTAIFLRLFRRFRIEAVALPGESRKDVERRLEEKLNDAGPVLVLQMKGIFDVKNDEDNSGLKLRLCRR